ncbi:MAG TPA: hypothetical protein VHT73_03770 [Thermodesulfobacteriota bacterium]|nr:hypothetical protein [Thermodesulfobacteriota bacterium]
MGLEESPKTDERKESVPPPLIVDKMIDVGIGVVTGIFTVWRMK